MFEIVFKFVCRSLKSLTAARSLVRLNVLGNAVCSRSQFAREVSFCQHLIVHDYLLVVRSLNITLKLIFCLLLTT